MQFRMEEAIGILERTPKVLDALLRGQVEPWLNCREATETFSAMDVLGHLLYGEAVDWIPRAKIILECGESRAFDPFDRRGFGPLVKGRAVERVLDDFAEARKQNLKTLGELGLDGAGLDRTGTHPGLGRVTVRQLLASWVVHDLGHVAQIARVMSREYREEVGPWREYLPILG
ncbi:MAG TPA: DinB family protein [Bryobacteraceae bacterium]|nr:DinB family protein [Bryobacteraceae bacterium]